MPNHSYGRRRGRFVRKNPRNNGRRFFRRDPRLGKFFQGVGKKNLRTGIAAQYAEDIDRWSSIALMDYKKHVYLYQRFGSIEVCLMEPAYWAIGKLSRYLDQDIQDLAHVFKKTRTHWENVLSVAGNAL